MADSSSVVDPGLQRDAETIGDTVCVGVVGRHCDDVQDVVVGEARLPERCHVGLIHLPRRRREFLDVGQHDSALFAESRRSPIGFDRGEEVVVLQETSQTATVVGESVVALVGGADNESDQLTFDLAERLRTGHRRRVHGLMRRQSCWVE